MKTNMTKNSIWQSKTLGEVCEVIAGQSPQGKFYNKMGKGLPFYQGKKEFTEKYIGDPSVWTTEVTKEAQVGDILISVRAPVGPVNFATQKICIGRGLAAIRPSLMIDKNFLYNFLKKQENEIVSTIGTVFNSINKTQIKAINIPIPSISEQRRIVKILDEVFAEIARVTENIETNLKSTRNFFETYLQNIFTNQNSGWKEKTLADIAENLDSKRVPITKNKRNEGKYPYYGASGIVDYVDDYLFDDNLLLISEDGANLLARAIPIAFSVSGKIWVNNHAHILKFNEITTQKYVERYFFSIKLDKYITGTAQPKLNQKALNSIPIPIPPISEQRTIVGKLDALSAETKKLEAIYKQKLADLEELKKSVLRKAFSGEL